MNYINKDAIKSYAANRLVVCPDLENDPNKILHLYSNLCFSFVVHNYRNRRIETDKTRRGVRDYLAAKENKICYSGGRFASLIRDCEKLRLVEIIDNKLVINIPEDSVRANDCSGFNLAVQIIAANGVNNITPAMLESYGLTIEHVVEAYHAIAKLLPEPLTKKYIRDKLKAKLFADADK